MNLHDIIHRDPAPAPWAEGEKIPWDDPEFSQRMLAEHLTDLHDAASRRTEKIDQHVDWINTHILERRPSRILDLGCGPGLYLYRLAQLGHTCVGIDFSPASIAYAREHSEAQNLTCEFIHGDVRQADFGANYDLIMMTFGELNVFRPKDARLILEKSHAALCPGGQLLLEVHTFEAVRKIGDGPGLWRSCGSGLFSARPHLLLQESFWDEEQHVASNRYFVIGAETASVERYADSIQAYCITEYETMLRDAGFAPVELFPALDGSDEPGDFVVYLATVS